MPMHILQNFPRYFLEIIQSKSGFQRQCWTIILRHLSTVRIVLFDWYWSFAIEGFWLIVMLLVHVRIQHVNSTMLEVINVINAGNWSTQTELIDPKCQICRSTPQIKKSDHLFLDLPKVKNLQMKDNLQMTCPLVITRGPILVWKIQNYRSLDEHCE